MIATSGLVSTALAIASFPSQASAITAQPSCDSRIARKPERTTSWSSAMRMRVTGVPRGSFKLAVGILVPRGRRAGFKSSHHNRELGARPHHGKPRNFAGRIRRNWHTESSASGALQAGTHHFALHGIIERHPRCFQLGSEGSAELLFQARYQRLAERNEMWWLRPKADVMPARFADDRLKQVALVEGADDGGDRIHQLEMLSFHVAGK